MAFGERLKKKKRKNSCDKSCCGSKQLFNRLLVSKRSEASRGGGGGFYNALEDSSDCLKQLSHDSRAKKLMIYATLRCASLWNLNTAEWRLLARDDWGSPWLRGGCWGTSKSSSCLLGLSEIALLLFQRRLPFISQAQVFTRGSVLPDASSGQPAPAWRHVLFQTERKNHV